MTSRGSGNHPISTLRSKDYYTSMKNPILVSGLAVCALAFTLLLVGCDKQVSSEKSNSVSSDGTVKSEDGTVTKTEESKKTTPPEKP